MGSDSYTKELSTHTGKWVTRLTIDLRSDLGFLRGLTGGCLRDREFEPFWKARGAKNCAYDCKKVIYDD